ncbi:LysR family transcriptional regulator [Puniceibacterium sp. IMCC21224]|uniref:LysR family transcriptional regulator n=1 Tax=Puniceibacterium sp. IMCC21224 TaxID=1618204 RepID=UPI00064DC056|nr:LysR family transcriptional regulator [Puniceibacterium sp. IMCC21224]KMK68304.1 transcriptional regulator [Puniceibacterium sp. IMCC21224]
MALHLTPRGLHYIEAVAEHGSIQAASRAIGIAASAIDRQIKLLEDRLGVLLFDRMTTGMALSPAGEMFVVLARRWKADENQILSDVKQMQGVDMGHIRIVAMDSLVNGLMPRFLMRMSESYPRVRVDVDVATPDGAVALLDEGQCDIVVAFNLRPQRDVHVLWSADLPLYCMVRPDHPLARNAEVALKDVRDHAIVVQSRALPIRRILEARHSWMFSDGPPPVVTNSLQLLKHLVVAGSHVALTSEMDAAPELLDGRMVAISVTGMNIPAQSISIAINSRRTLPRISKGVSDILSSEAQSLLESVRHQTALYDHGG